MAETDIECGHTKTALHVRGINKSCKMISFSHLNFKEGHFNLQKWKTNSAQLNDQIYNENKEIHTKDKQTKKRRDLE